MYPSDFTGLPGSRLTLACERPVNRSHDIAGNQTVLVEQLLGGAGLGVGVMDTDELHDAGTGLGHHLGDAHAEASIDQMLLADDDRARLRRRARDRLTGD